MATSSTTTSSSSRRDDEDEDDVIGDKELLTLLEGRLKKFRAVKQRLQHVESERVGLEEFSIVQGGGGTLS